MKSAGVMLMELDSARSRQYGLFDEPASADADSRKTLMTTLDTINRRMSKGSLKLTSEGQTQCWKVKAELKSPCYTTRGGRTGYRLCAMTARRCMTQRRGRNSSSGLLGDALNPSRR